MDAAAGRQDRGDGTNTRRLEKGCRRRTRRGIARSDSGGGASKPAVRGRTQGRDAVAGAARRHCRGGRIPRDGGSCASPAGGTSQAPPRGRGVAVGLEAGAYPPRAGATLKNMLEAWGRAESADPNYDEAGPARVRALVLIRAPGWPLGPGDAEAGLAAARRAVALQPQYPPNLLAPAEALGKTGDPDGAPGKKAHARETALA